jgi:hypothetical protein
MVSDNAQWINNDNNVNLNDNILCVSNDNNVNISTNIIKKKIKKIHNIKKFKNNYKNVMELKNIYEPSDELLIEPKFGDILIDYPTNIEPIQPIIEGLQEGYNSGNGNSNKGDGLNHTDEAEINKTMDKNKNIIIDEYNSIKTSAYNSIPRPIIDFFGYIYLFLYSPSNYYGKTCVDWMDFGELFKDNPYSEYHLNDIEYIDKLLTQIFWYCFMYIPFIIIFLLAILLIWLKKCFRVMDKDDAAAKDENADLNIDRPMIFENISDINIFGNANDTNSINTTKGGKTDINAVSKSVSNMLSNVKKNMPMLGNTDDNHVDNHDETSKNKETDILNGTLPIPWFRYTTILSRIIAFIIIIIPVKFIKIQILYISIIYIIIILLYIYFYYSIANCNNSNTNTVYVFEIMFCIYAILLVFDIFGRPLYGFITTTSEIETTSITYVSFDYINKLVNSIVDYINNKIKGTKVDASSDPEPTNVILTSVGKSLSGSSEIKEAFSMKNKTYKLLSPVWWFYCFCVTIFFYFMSCFSLIFLPIVLFIEIIKISEIGIMKTIKLYGLYLIQLFNILSFNIIPSLLTFYNQKTIVNDYFNFDEFLKEFVIDEQGHDIANTNIHKNPDNVIYNKYKHFMIISFIPFTLLISAIVLFISYFPQLSNKTPHSQLIIFILYGYISFTSTVAIFRNLNIAFKFFKKTSEIPVDNPIPKQNTDNTGQSVEQNQL